MEVAGESGDSVYLRGFGDYERSSLKLTAADAGGRRARRLSHAQPGGARRAGSTALEAAGVEGAWLDGDLGHGRRLQLPRSRRPPLRALLRVRALRGSARAAAGAEEPAAALPGARRRGAPPRPRQLPRRRPRREPRLPRGVPRPAADRADRARRRHRGGRVARLQPEVVRRHVHARPDADARPAAPHRLLRRPARGRAPRGGHLPRARDRDGVGPAQARDPADVLPLHLGARREPGRGLRRRLPDLRARPRAGRLVAGGAREGAGVGDADGRELPHQGDAAGARGGSASCRTPATEPSAPGPRARPRRVRPPRPRRAGSRRAADRRSRARAALRRARAGGLRAQVALRADGRAGGRRARRRAGGATLWARSR